MDTGPEPARVAGLDVAANRLDVHVRPDGLAGTASNDPTGPRAVARRLAALDVTLVGGEATGGDERPAAADLATAEVPVAIVTPRHVRAFAEAIGQLAKTDRLDAALLAPEGAAGPPAPRPLPDAATQPLKDLVARRADLGARPTAEQQRRGRATGASRAGIAAPPARRKTRSAALERAIAALIRATDAGAATAPLRMGTPGVALITAATRLANRSELGQWTRQAVAALGGVAPLNRDGGARRGKRACWGGRGEVRRVRDLAAGPGAPDNPPLRTCRARRLATGKLKTAALVAWAHQLLTIRNATVRDGAPWTASEAAAA